MAMLLLAIAVLLFLGVVGTQAPRGDGGGWIGRFVYLGSAAACLVGAGAVAMVLVGHLPVETQTLPIGLPWVPSRLRLDGLAAVFLLLINGIGVVVSIYAVGYGRHEDEPHRVLPFYPLFLAGMNIVPLADDAFTFMVAWEFMSVMSWLLVLASHRQRETRHAALVYLIMAGFGTAALVLAFGTLAGVSGTFTFDSFRAADVPPGVSAVVVILLVLGAGSKAGVVPLHAWLPLAHPAAPSHVSALMSGVMTKVALYAMVRFLFDLLGTPVWWWGLLLIVVGGVTAVLGVLYAVLQRDLKTMLAYSTVENIGVIVTGIGLGLAFAAEGHAALAGLSLLAALFHAINHSLFKTLLFLGAGAVATATNQRDLDKLGGLIHRLPVTAVTFLVGAAAIAALPPLNGFASEWLLFQAVLSGTILGPWLLKLAVPVVGAMLALSTALASATFVRAFGLVFLGRPRSAVARAAAEVEGSMRVPLLVLAGGCVVLGVVPALTLAFLTPVVEGLVGGAPLAAATDWLWLEPVVGRASSYSGTILFLAVAGMALVTLLVRRVSSGRFRRSDAWDCGFPDPSPASQYTASSFSQPIRRMFGTAIFTARENIDMPEPSEIRPARLVVSVRDPVWHWVYRPVGGLVGWVTHRLAGIQLMTFRENLAVMFAALLGLLVLVMVVR